MKKCRRIISIVLIAIMLLPTLSAAMSVFAVDDALNYLVYENKNNEITITGYKGEPVNIAIPSEIEGKPVTSIGDYAFRDCSSIQSIIIPDSVTSIGEFAFLNCSNLPSIIIPDSVENIDYGIVDNCSSLYEIIVDENNENFSSVDGILFNKNKTELIRYPMGKTGKSYTIPDSVTSIGNGAFYECSILQSITIPDSVINIGWYAFEYCSSLQSITIPDSVKSIDYIAFDGCSSLYEIVVDKNNENYSSENGVLFNKNKNYLICYPAGKTDAAYIIPDSVTIIEDRAFRGCSSLQSITIPDYVSIGWYAFDGCSSLQSITISDSVTGIYRCTIYDTAYYKNASNWENGVLYIGNYLIGANTDISSDYTIKDGTKTITGTGFDNCSNLLSITIPDSVINIESWSFDECSSLATVNYTGTQAQWNAIYINSIGNECLTTATINYNYVPCPHTNTTSHEKTAATCTTDGYTAGEQCDDCGKWISGHVIIEKHHTDENNDSICDVCNEAIKTIVAQGNCGAEGDGSNVTYVLYDDGSLVISGTGEIANSDYIWQSQSCGVDIISVTIKNGITKIGESAFNECRTIESIELPDTLVSIGRYAFSSCVKLRSIDIPESVEFIDVEAFFNCCTLESVNIPDLVPAIEDGTFSHCHMLSEIELPDSIAYIGENAFDHCHALESITIPDSVTSIGSGAFNDCPALKSVVISKNANSISDQTFQYCTSLESITIPNSVTSISWNAFFNCTSLTTVNYTGTAEQWNEISIDYGNNCLTSATINFASPCAHANTTSHEETAATCTTDGYTAGEQCDDCGKWISGHEVIEKHHTDENNDSICDVCNEAIKTIVDQDDCGNEGTYGDLTYMEYDTYIEITDCSESATSVEIPAEINGKPVTSIFGNSYDYFDGAFYECSNLTSITIPNSVTNIGDCAFKGCTSLESITIPASVTNIGDFAFEKCVSLSSIYVDANNEYYCSVDGVLFNKDKSDLVCYPAGKTAKSYTIPDSVINICIVSFKGCISLESITIPDSVTSIAFSAFSGCSNLSNITIPDSITSIGNSAFFYTAYDKDESNWENGVLYIGNYLIDAKINISGNYTIKSGTKIIADHAFFCCRSLESITIPDSVTSIGDLAFYDCSGLESIIIPGSVASIGDYAFGFCNSLESVIISEGVETIGEYTFYYCESLAKVALPESLTAIKNSAFANCDSIDTFVILSKDFTVWHNSLPSIVDGYYIVASNMVANAPEGSNIIPFTYEDNVLSFDGKYSSNAIDFLDMIAMFCIYYGNEKIIESVRFNDLDLFVDKNNEIIKKDVVLNVEVILNQGGICEPCSFNELCMYAGNQKEFSFYLIASAGSDFYDVRIDVTESDKTHESPRTRGLRAIVTFLNKIFSFFGTFFKQ